MSKFISHLLSGVLFFFLQLSLMGQVVTEWEKTMGGSDEDKARSIVQTMDGGYIVAGYSKSTSGDITGNQGGVDFWISKMAMNGQMDWQENFGGSGKDQATQIKECSDGSFIVVGTSYSKDLVTINSEKNKSAMADFLIVKIDVFGHLKWAAKYGGSQNEFAHGVDIAEDGSIYVVGSALSGDGYLNKNHGEEDAWVIKLNTEGELLWQKAIGGKLTDEARAVVATKDGGCVVVGSGQSKDGDLHDNYGENDFMVLKFNSRGSVEWSKNFGGPANEVAESVQICPDGNFVVAGYSNSKSGDVSQSKGEDDVWIIKVSRKGELIWENSFGGSRTDKAHAIDIVPSVGFIVAGSSNSKDGIADNNKGGTDVWVLKLDTKGKLIWEKKLGGSSTEAAFSISQSFDAGYILTGFTNSSDGDIKDTKGFWDYWIVKLKEVPPRITAICFEDQNLNGKFEQSEPLKRNQVLLLRPKAFHSFADPVGNSIFYVEPGAYKLNCVPQEGWELSTDSLEYNVLVEEDADIVRYFGFMPEGSIKPDEIPEKIETEVAEDVVVEIEAPVLKKKEPVKHKTLRKSSDIECGKILELSKLTFRPNTSSFTKEKAARDYLELLTDFMKANPTSNIQVYGHTDFLSKNKDWLHELSEQRVERVKELLTKKGIDESRIKTKAFGGTLPIVKDKEDPNRSKNRRVEVEISCD